MVRWLNPGVLLAAGLRVIVSGLFGEYADKREFQAALDREPGPPLAYGASDQEDGALWLDFVADLGDGFDSTYAVACLLGRRRLELAGERFGLPAEATLPRGRALVMGGDEVYPSATREEYENRFRGPYAAALPAAKPAPDLLAIPGNHDWYDGLTNFLRFFCAQREVGGWQTQQRRSYFALQLPHRWWVLAIDIQLDTFIDAPQLTYFEENVQLEQGDRVILVTGKPSWVKVTPDEVPDSYKNLQYFVDKVVTKAGAQVRVTLTGDLHHYFRYRADNGGHDLITCGGGGAYLYPTHTTPRALQLPEGSYERESCYPSREDSKALTKGARWLPRLAPRLCGVIAALYAGFSASLYAAIEVSAAWSIATVAVGLTMLLSLLAYADGRNRGWKLGLGLLHSAVHLLLAAIPAALAAVLFDSAWLVPAVAAVAAALGYLVGGIAFGEYLILSHRHAPRHANEVLACQAIPDYKSFLRMRLDADGLTIYPLAVRRVPRAWEHNEKGAGGEEPLLRPTDGETLQVELIEAPVEIA